MTNKLTKEYIIKTCKKYNIKNYTINDDLSIDVNDSVILSNKELTELPLIFNIIKGDFYCDNNNLTSLKGAPRKCVWIDCCYNNLTSLDGAPDECIYLSCTNNNLISLKGAPKSDYIGANYNKLNLDNEDLYVIEALANNYIYNNELKDYLKIRQRNEFINTILD